MPSLLPTLDAAALCAHLPGRLDSAASAALAVAAAAAAAVDWGTRGRVAARALDELARALGTIDGVPERYARRLDGRALAALLAAS